MRHTLTIYGDMRAWLEMAKAERCEIRRVPLGIF
jgi:hypothetical protein